LTRPTRLIVPAARMTSSTAALLLACGVMRAGLFTLTSPQYLLRLPIKA
jgi:hypothetical protein